jgi:hypothetical protein
MVHVVLLIGEEPGAAQSATGPAVRFRRVTIDARPPRNPWMKVVADLNGDGQPDIVVAGSRGPLVWYEAPGWQKHTAAAGGYATVDGEAADIDGDGDPDLALGGVVWLENPGPDASVDLWTTHRVAQLRSHDVEVADLDQDGKLDLVTRDQSSFGRPVGNQLQIWRQRDRDAWTRRNLACPQGEGLKLGDVDQDGDADVIVGGRWFENSGDILDGAWTEHVFTTRWTHPDAMVAWGDLSGDGRPDIVLAPAELEGGSYSIAWYEAPAVPRGVRWEEHVLESAQETVVHALELADFNGDGELDIVMAEMHQGADPDEVRVYLNRGHGRGWSRQVIDTCGSHDVAVGDIGADGDCDIVGANHGGPDQALYLWENQTRVR